jgi:hypothetical protein
LTTGPYFLREESTQRSFNTLRASLFEYCGRRKYAKKLQYASRLSFRVLWEKKVRKEASMRFASLFSSAGGRRKYAKKLQCASRLSFRVLWEKKVRKEASTRFAPFLSGAGGEEKKQKKTSAGCRLTPGGEMVAAPGFEPGTLRV